MLPDVYLKSGYAVLPIGQGRQCSMPRPSVRAAGQLHAFGLIGRRAIVGVTDADGKSIFAGRTATAFTNAEGSGVTSSAPLANTGLQRRF